MAEDKEVKRLNYFKGQFLQEEDFNAEQAYHMRMRRLLNLALHTWGVVEGLEVTQVAGTNSVVVAPGIAIDKMGQEIMLPIPGSASVPISGVTKGDVFITISYGEVDDPADKYTTAGVEGKFKRKTERPLPPKAEAAPPAGASLAILLAKVSVEGGNVVAIDNSVRRLVNSSMFTATDLTVRSLAWGNNSRLQTDQGGSIELGGDPNTPGKGTPYIDFHFSGKTEDYNARIINDGDGVLTLRVPVFRIAADVGVGATTPGAKLTVQQGPTAAGAAATGKGLFVSAVMGTGAASDGGIEFRHDNLTQGIGFGYNTIYATGSNANQDLSIQSRGTGSVLLNPSQGNVGIGSPSAPKAKLQVSGGAIMPAAGNSAQAGIQFPSDPGGGAGDEAFIRYFAVSGEATKLLIGIGNDPDDSIGLFQAGSERMTIHNGNVGIGTPTPGAPLSVYRPGAASGVYGNLFNDTHQILIGVDASAIVSAMTASDLQLRTNNTTRMLIQANTGNVGIGAAAPGRKLVVDGNSTILAGTSNWGEGLRIIAKGNDMFAATLYGRADADVQALWFTGIGSFGDNNRESDLIFLSGPGRGAPDTSPFASSTLEKPYRADAVMVLEHSTGNALFGAGLGIGTPTPESRLHLKVPASSSPIGAMTVDVDSFGTGPNSQASYFFRVRDIGAGPSTPFYIRGDGNVGIGTTTPGFKLDVAERMRVRQGGTPSSGIWFFQTTPNEDRAFVGMATDTQVGFWGNTGAKWGLVMDTSTGNVGIGAAPTADSELFVAGTTGFRQGYQYLSGAAGGSSFSYNAHRNATNNAWVFPDPGRVAVTVEIDDAGGGGRFEIYSTLVGAKTNWRRCLRVDGETTDTTITGNLGTHGFPPTAKKASWGGGVRTWDVEAEGTIWSNNGVVGNPHDLAENYLSDEDLAPGDVVCLDAARDKVVVSERPNDALLIGIISTAPGVLLNGMHGEEDSVPGMLPYPVALCGRVPCKVTDENGPIHRGDLLTTSSTPGRAMKALPVKVAGIDFYHPGTVIGKALEAHKSGKGMIEVFVALR